MRYDRQILMKSIGEEGQEKLKNSRVLVIGAGGLGSPVLYYLAAAGVGHITVLDNDTVNITNLNRQILHFEKDIDEKKVDSAKEKLSQLNSEIEINTISERLTEENAFEIMSGYSVIVDCVDNVDTRVLVSKMAQRIDTPIVEAGVEAFSGFVMCIKKNMPCIGCLYQNIGVAPPTKRVTPVIGAMAGVIGSLQAVQAIRLLTNASDKMFSQVLLIDMNGMSFQNIQIDADENCNICGENREQ